MGWSERGGEQMKLFFIAVFCIVSFAVLLRVEKGYKEERGMVNYVSVYKDYVEPNSRVAIFLYGDKVGVGNARRYMETIEAAYPDCKGRLIMEVSK